MTAQVPLRRNRRPPLGGGRREFAPPAGGRIFSWGGLSSYLAVLLPLAASLAAPAAAAPRVQRPKILPGRDVELKTADGWTLAARYQPAKEKPATVVLLHSAGGRKEDWYYLARAAASRGFGVLALDLRGHGGSQAPPEGVPAQWRQFKASRDANEWSNMVQDAEAAARYLAAEKVPEEAIVVGGADVGSSIALRYAAVHREASRIFMLSPGMSYREVLTVNAMRAYGPRPILLVAASEDKRSTAETAILFEFAKRSAGEANAVLVSTEREHGTRMLLMNPGLIERVVEWLENPAPPQPPLPSDRELPPAEPPQPSSAEEPEES